MNRSAMQALRAANPHPETLAPPPIGTVLGRLEDRRPPSAGAGRRHRSRRSAGGWAIPLVTSAVVVAVLIVVLVSLRPDGARHRAAYAPARPGAVGTQSSLRAPRNGMRGTVGAADTTALNPDGAGIASVSQCVDCHRNGDVTSDARQIDWLLSTDLSGRETLRRVPYLLISPQLAGRDGWASGEQAVTHAAEYYVTHDGGHHWAVASSAVPNNGDPPLSIGDGEVWSVGQSVTQSGTTTSTSTVVLHAPTSSSRLLATAAQPVHGTWGNAQIAAAGPDMAYLYDDATSGATYRTTDDGRSWQQLARACPTGDAGRLTDAAFGDSVWVVCTGVTPHRGRSGQLVDPTTLARSTDGGRHWTQLATPFGASYVPLVSPASTSVLWALTGGGQILRSADAGATWHTVWSLADQVPELRASYLRGTYPGELLAQSADIATMQVTITHGRPGSTAAYTNLVRYRTTNGGRTWTPSIVSLATH